MPLILALLLLAGCATPKGPWVVQGVASADEEAKALALVEAAKRVLPDEKGWLAWGGTIWLQPDLTGICSVPPPKRPTACTSPRSIWLLYPHPVGGLDVLGSALPHELCHLGLATGGAFSGPLDLKSDTEADACAARVLEEYRRRAP